MTDPTLHENYVFIRKTMAQVYDSDQLELLCADLDIRAGDLRHNNTVSGLADALLRRMHQTGRRGELIALLRQERDNVEWPDDYTYPGNGDDPEQTSRPRGDRLPYGRNPLFTGREADLRALAAFLLTTDHSPLTTILSGLGGVGKTQLAVEFAHRYGDRFLAVQWLSLADERAAEGEVAACGRAMGLWADADENSLSPAIKAEKTLRAWEADEPRLLIFDNCEEPALLERWRPKRGGARLLVTSRRERWPAELPARLYPLRPLVEPESVALLRRHLIEGDNRPPRGDVADDELRAIAAELGELPLALALAGRYLRRYGRVTPAGYLAELRRPGLLHPSLRLEAGHSPTGHERDVWRTVALSYDRLRPDAGDPPGNLAVKGAALALLARAACFAPGEPLPAELLLATLTTDPPTLADEGLERLLASGLLEGVAAEAATEARYRLHRLIARFVEEEEEGSRQDAKNAKEKGEEEAGVMAARGAVEGAVIDLAYRQNTAGDPRALRAWAVHIRHVTDAAFDREDNTAATLCSNLGYYLRMAGDLAGARTYYERALAVRERVLGPDHPDTATSLNNLGFLLQAQGDLAGARPYYERALTIDEKVLDTDHPDTAIDYNNLGFLLQDQGDLAGARPYLERALAVWERVLGPDHPATAQGLNNLGSLLQAQGDLAGARPYYERALAVRERVLGPDHPATATSLNNLGRLLQDQGDLAGARPYLERALAVSERVLGPDHPDTAGSLNNLGGLLQDQGDLAGARPYLERALAVRERVLGPDHPDTAQGLNNLGSLLQDQGDLAGARPYFERALPILEARLGADHPNTRIVRGNLAAIEAAMGED